MYQLCVFGESMRVHVRYMEQLLNIVWVFTFFQSNYRCEVVNRNRVFVHVHYSAAIVALSPEPQSFLHGMACYSQDTLQCVAAEVAGEIWPAGWGCSRGVSGIGVLYLVASPTQRFMDYEVLYRPAGTQVICRLGTASSCYGISSADTSLDTIQGYLGYDFVRVPEEYVSYAEYPA